MPVILTVLIAVLSFIAFICLLAFHGLVTGPGRQVRLEPFKKTYIAHRGLHSEDVPENSLMSIKNAVSAGYGIELDVRLTKDGKLVVFHDADLFRMCGRTGGVEDYTYGELSEMKLLGTAENIPLFSDVAGIIPERTPLIIEVKSGKKEKDTQKTLRVLLTELGKREGNFCIEAFDPLVLIALKKKRPDIIRGQLSDNYMRRGKYIPGGLILSNMMLNFMTRPDFAAYNKKYPGILPLRFIRRYGKTATAAWTVRSEQEMENTKKSFEIIIFEGFLP